MRPIVDRLIAKNYGCLKKVDISLTPLHCFIGPNDSGKSTILRAVQTLSRFLDQPIPHIVQSDAIEIAQLQTHGAQLHAWKGPNGFIVQHHEQHHFMASFCTGSPEKASLTLPLKPDHMVDLHQKKESSVAEIMKVLYGTRTVRLDSNALQKESKLIRGPEIDFLDERGLGLPAVYDAIASQDAEEYVRIIGDVKRLFPSIEKVQLIGTSDSTKTIYATLVTGERIPPNLLSSGLLYFLAYAAIPYLHPCKILLVEEPENGLHPARIAEVMRILREVSKTTQVLIATHSPLVVNELQPEEVSIVTRDPEEGTKVTPMKETPNFEERSKVYALGELWVSYANGDDEGPLLNATAPEDG